MKAAIAAAAETVNRYPDNGCVELREHLAKHVNFAPEHIAVSGGSVSLSQQLIQITCTVGDEVMYGWRSFEVYPLQVTVAGATPVHVPLRDYTFDLDAMLDAITDRTRLIFVCNPNNPTSTVVDPDALDRFVAAVPSDIMLCIDEAYVEYIRDGLVPDSLGLARKHSNVVVLRTFSKAYGLAGLRVGYAIADPEVIVALGKVYVPFNATTVSQAAAIASWPPRTSCSPAPTPPSPNAPGSPRRCGSWATSCRRRRRTSSGCRWRIGPSTSPSSRPTHGCSCGRSPATACGDHRGAGGERRVPGLRAGLDQFALAGRRPVSATSRSSGSASSGTSTGSSNPARPWSRA